MTPDRSSPHQQCAFRSWRPPNPTLGSRAVETVQGTSRPPQSRCQEASPSVVDAPDLPPSVLARALVERGVDGERTRDDERVQRLSQRPVDLYDVVVALGEHLLGRPGPRLGDPGDLVSGAVLNVEVPRIPALGADGAEGLATGLEGE